MAIVIGGQADVHGGRYWFQSLSPPSEVSNTFEMSTNAATMPASFAVDRLKDRAERFTLELRNRFEVLAEETDADSERRWMRITRAIIGSAENTIRRRRGTYKEHWIQNQTWDLVDEHRLDRQKQDQARTE
ncbi:hypothetical protein R1flu_025473 [Riccia fluitans]|uniref:Uncharacterized protein n=1 Tax=Riccia fluitans TaxID=41844 RepID=A0ABD1Y0W8_9MARC